MRLRLTKKTGVVAFMADPKGGEREQPAIPRQPKDYQEYKRFTEHRPSGRISPWRKWLMLLVVVLGVFLAGILSMVLMVGPEIRIEKSEDSLIPLPKIATPKPAERVILAMGVDDARRIGETDPFKGARTDTMMLVRISPNQNTVAVVSIPRDSKVYLAGDKGIDRVNAAHAYGGADLAVRTVEDSFGIPVDNYILVNYRGVREIVNLLGGVDIYVSKPMHYRDRTAGLTINFDKGMHHMNGEEAEAFLRFRHDALGDIGRIRRQQQFLTALSRKLKEPGTMLKLPLLVNEAQKYVRTDLSFDEMVRLAGFIPEVDFKNIRTATLPGHPSRGRISYWIVDPVPAQEVLDRMILNNPTGPDGASSDQRLKVGIIYDPALGQSIEEMAGRIEQKDFQIVCKRRQRNINTRIVEHTERVNSRYTRELQEADKRLRDVRLIFSPVGTTFEADSCSAAEDYTVFVGPDSR